jgi:hypothetical protein
MLGMLDNPSRDRCVSCVLHKIPLRISLGGRDKAYSRPGESVRVTQRTGELLSGTPLGPGATRLRQFTGIAIEPEADLSDNGIPPCLFFETSQREFDKRAERHATQHAAH